MIFNSPNEPVCYLFVTQNCIFGRQPDTDVTFRRPDGPAQAGRVPGGQQPDDRCQHDERLLERRWISSREVSRTVTVAKAGQSGLRERLGMDLAELAGGGLARVVAEAGQEGFELAGLAFREGGAESPVEGHGGVTQGRPLRDDDSPAASPWPPGRPGLDEGPPAQGRPPRVGPAVVVPSVQRAAACAPPSGAGRQPGRAAP
jgi:hypothetical protein